jgi:3-hydroxyisobutyrate dehydrogenase-like beta-hydroxyacid dehydrogenase
LTIVGIIEVLSQALALGEKSGLDPEAMLGVLETMYPGNIMPGYIQRIARGQFEAGAGFAVTLAMKVSALIVVVAEYIRR